ncbi:MAG TPA: AAA family ATPase [Streptosporangiaceae bacterium]|nr:AAA family ATPase [Streptosporangiaceae bacterium]
MPDGLIAQVNDGANPFWSADLFVGRGPDVRRFEHLLREGRSTLLIGGRRAGKTTMARRLSAARIQRTLVLTDAAGWDLSSESASLGALRGALDGVSATAYAQAARHDLVKALEAACPVTLVIDEADRILLAPWGPAFFAFLRWLDDAHLRDRISILLVGGPVLMLFRDPDDKGSPPLNTAEPRYISPLNRDAVSQLAQLADKADDCDEIVSLCGGHAWLTTRLLAEMWEGASLEEASDIIFDSAVATFRVWEKQLGAHGRDLLRKLPSGGVSRSDFKKPPWARFREATVFGQCIGVVRRDGDRVCSGPRLFMDWFANDDSGEVVWDVAISYASEDESVAREIYAQLRGDFSVFFAPEESAGLWGSDLNRVLPNTYGVQSKYVLVLSTSHYVSKYWTKVEYESVADKAPGRILLVDLGALPIDLPRGLVYRGSSNAEMIGLMDALRSKLASR